MKKKHSKETRERMSDARREWWQKKKENDQPLMKRIINVVLGMVPFGLVK